MQTFLPYADFTASSVVLDDRRLGKQRVETFQILRALTWPEYAWKNHPAVRMWRGFVPALVAYGLANCAEWVRRGNADTVEASLLAFTGGERPDPAELAVAGLLPPWMGLPLLHLSHRSALVRKQPEHYRPVFGDVPDDLPYLWPEAAFPRWPVRRPPVPGLGGALTALGFDEPRPGQAESVDAVGRGRDILACFAPGAGATATGLLAALSLPTGDADGATGPTLWVGSTAGGGGLVPEDGVVGPPPRERLIADGADEAGKPAPGPLARPPGAADVLAMREEADAVPDIRFHRAADLADPAVSADLRAAPPALVVVDESGDDEAAALVCRWRAGLAAGHRPPLLVLTGEADAHRRTALAEAYGLDRPVSTGGGFDPADLLLGVVRVPDENRRRDVVASLLVRTGRPGLVLGGTDDATRRLARALLSRGARITALPSVARRAARTAAVGQWRRGSLRALVVGLAALPTVGGLGRRGPGFVLVADGLEGRDRRAVLELLRAGLPGRSEPVPVVFVAVDGELDVFGADDCRRAALLDVVGEPVTLPCGRCDVCRDAPGDAAALLQPPN